MTRCYERKFRIPAKSTSRLTLEAPVLGLRQLWTSQDTSKYHRRLFGFKRKYLVMSVFIIAINPYATRANFRPNMAIRMC